MRCIDDAAEMMSISCAQQRADLLRNFCAGQDNELQKGRVVGMYEAFSIALDSI